jgi:hypothetical protein
MHKLQKYTTAAALIVLSCASGRAGCLCGEIDLIPGSDSIVVSLSGPGPVTSSLIEGSYPLMYRLVRDYTYIYMPEFTSSAYDTGLTSNPPDSCVLCGPYVNTGTIVSLLTSQVFHQQAEQSSPVATSSTPWVNLNPLGTDTYSDFATQQRQTATVGACPEPSTLLLLCGGLPVLIASRRRLRD